MYLYIFFFTRNIWCAKSNQLSFTLVTLCWCKFVADETARYSHNSLNQEPVHLMFWWTVQESSCLPHTHAPTTASQSREIIIFIQFWFIPDSTLVIVMASLLNYSKPHAGHRRKLKVTFGTRMSSNCHFSMRFPYRSCYLS